MTASTFRVDTTKFNAMLAQLSSKVAGANYADVVAAEVGKVLEATIKYTPALKVEKVRQRYDSAEYTQQLPSLYTPTSKSGQRYRSKVKLSKSGAIKYYLGNRYPAQLWARIAAARKKRLQRVLRARGLAKRSWLALAEQLGLSIKAPQYVARAQAVTGKTYQDTSVKAVANRKQAYVTLTNSQPTVNAIGGGRALQRAIDGRVKYFERSVQLRVFDDMKKVAKQYPGIRTNS